METFAGFLQGRRMAGGASHLVEATETESPYLYHGTAAGRARQIRRAGLRPSAEKGPHSDEGVYVTTEPDVALAEAIATCTGVDVTARYGGAAARTSRKGQPVILVLDRTKVKGLREDEEYAAGVAFVTSQAVPASAIIDEIHFVLEKGFKWQPVGSKYEHYRRISHRPATGVRPPEPPKRAELPPESAAGRLAALAGQHRLLLGSGDEGLFIHYYLAERVLSQARFDGNTYTINDHITVRFHSVDPPHWLADLTAWHDVGTAEVLKHPRRRTETVKRIGSGGDLETLAHLLQRFPARPTSAPLATGDRHTYTKAEATEANRRMLSTHLVH